MNIASPETEDYADKEKSHKKVVQIMILGDGAVGKTSIIKRFDSDEYAD